MRGARIGPICAVGAALCAALGCGDPPGPPPDDVPTPPPDVVVDVGVAPGVVADVGCGARAGVDAAPNLTLDPGAMRCSYWFEERDFAADACEVTEGCVQPGPRRLLRFDAVVSNVSDVAFAAPASPIAAVAAGDPSCGHHATSLVEYELRDRSGLVLLQSGRAPDCLADSRRDAAGAPRARFTCESPGLQGGWSAVFASTSRCQWIDVTGFPAGDYQLRARVNARRAVAESTYCDNEVSVPVAIPAALAPVNSGCPAEGVTSCGAVTSRGEARECGWTLRATRPCVRGAEVTVGCNAACAPSVGSCTGDPVLRVCPGAAPCSRASALGSSDDACGSRCPSVTVTCPASGMITALAGAYVPGAPFDCAIAVR